MLKDYPRFTGPLKLTRRSVLVGGISATVMMLSSRFFTRGTREISVTRHKLKIAEGLALKNIVNIVQISDLHLSSLDAMHAEVIDIINNISPDLLFITGDTINVYDQLPLLRDFVSRLRVADGIYAVLGNWEYWSQAGISNIRWEYRRAGCRLLVNEQANVSINGLEISITGVDDYSVGRPDVALTNYSAVPSGYKILLTHCPAYRDIVLKKFDLVLAGHTHGGQIVLWGYVPYLPLGSGGYVAGWYHPDSDKPLYVNRGIGTTRVPARIGAPPEIAHFMLLPTQ